MAATPTADRPSGTTSFGDWPMDPMVGFDAQAGGELGDGDLAGLTVVFAGVDVGAAGEPVTAGGLGVGPERDGPMPGTGAAGGEFAVFSQPCTVVMLQTRRRPHGR
jgi:hypothetical protein